MWLDQITTSFITGMYVDPKAGRATFAAFYDEWSARQIWAPGTVLAMSLAARSVPFKDKPVRLIRRADVEVWVKAMDEMGLAPGTVKTRFVNVRSVFRAAVRDRAIGVDPTDAVRLPRRRRVDSAMSIPTPKEVGLMMSAASAQARTLIALCAFAGLRLGEAAAVQTGDIDFHGKSLKVTRQVQRLPGGAVDVRAPKYGSERVIHLADGLLDLLEPHVAGLGKAHGEGWLFIHNGGPPHQNTTGYWWRKALQDARLTGIKFHDLRHFYASGLIAAGCDVVTVQFALGHAKTSTTLNTYAHLWPSSEDRTRSAAQSIIAASLGTSQTSSIRDNTRVQANSMTHESNQSSTFRPVPVVPSHTAWTDPVKPHESTAPAPAITSDEPGNYLDVDALIARIHHLSADAYDLANWVRTKNEQA